MRHRWESSFNQISRDVPVGFAQHKDRDVRGSRGEAVQKESD